jgi:hypothetical protein
MKEAFRVSKTRIIRTNSARDRVQRHGQHQRREAAQQGEHDGDTHVCRMLSDARELCRDPLNR